MLSLLRTTWLHSLCPLCAALSDRGYRRVRRHARPQAKQVVGPSGQSIDDPKPLAVRAQCDLIDTLKTVGPCINHQHPGEIAPVDILDGVRLRKFRPRALPIAS